MGTLNLNILPLDLKKNYIIAGIVELGYTDCVEEKSAKFKIP